MSLPPKGGFLKSPLAMRREGYSRSIVLERLQLHDEGSIDVTCCNDHDQTDGDAQKKKDACATEEPTHRTSVIFVDGKGFPGNIGHTTCSVVLDSHTYIDHEDG